MQQPKLPVVLLVAQESTVIKHFNMLKHRVKVVLRGNTPRPKVLQAVPVAMTAVPASMEQPLQTTLRRPSALNVLRTPTVRNKEEILHVIWFHLDSIDLVPPPKSNAQQVKLALVGMPLVKIVKLDGFKIYRAILRVVNVP